MPRKRYSSESNQEAISRRQFGELINYQMHWITSDIEPDIGEDILIRICRDGVPTGISFQVQLKSVKDIGEKLLKDGKTISYRFDTDTLLHWDVQLIPVYIVIWDITVKQSWFISIKDAIKWLDNNSPNWITKSTVTLHIPINNMLNQSNLLSIQTLLTKKLGPTILKDKQLVVNAEFSFTKKEGDQEKLKQLQDFFNAGDAVELDGK